MPKVNVDSALLLKVAENARLKLTDEEISKFLPQLQEILDTFSKLDNLPVSDEKPSFQPMPIKNVFREDKIYASLPEKDVFSNAKSVEKKYFKGPKVI